MKSEKGNAEWFLYGKQAAPRVGVEKNNLCTQIKNRLPFATGNYFPNNSFTTFDRLLHSLTSQHK